MADRHNYQWISYLQLSEAFKEEKIIYGTENSKIDFEMQLCAGSVHVIAKINKMLLKFEPKEEQVK